MILPARIVAQKGIEKGMAVANSYAIQNQEEVAFIVTGAPDLRKPENVTYWERIQALAKEYASAGNGKLHILFLGGATWDFMPWLYKNSTIMLAPFKNEGFSLTPVEAGMVGLNAAISEDPAQLETTQANALLIPDEEWESPDIAAHRIKRYIGSSQAATDIEELRRVADDNYSPEAITQKTLQLLKLR
jgi:glycosyltransferase involved in cell wall biosynthesis